MKRRIFLAAGLAGCKRETTALKEPIMVSVNRRPGMAGLYTAVEGGYFTAAGLPVALQTLSSGMEVVPLVAAGKIDVGFFPANAAVFNAIAKGARIRMVAGREVLKPGCSDFGAIYGRPDVFPQGLTDLRQLKGKVIATNGGLNINQFALDVLLDSVGLKLTDVSVKHMQPGDAITALRGKQIDALVAMHLYGPGIRERFPGWARHPGLVGLAPGFQYGYVYFGSRMLDLPVDVGGRFLAAYLRGTREYLGGKTPKFLDDVAKASGFEPEQTKNFCREVAVEDGSVITESLRFYNEWAVKRGHCEKMVSIEQMMDMRFLEYARKHPV